MDQSPLARIAEMLGNLFNLVFGFIGDLLLIVLNPVRDGLDYIGQAVGLGDSKLFYWIVLGIGILLVAESLRGFWKRKRGLPIIQIVLGSILIAAISI